MDIPAVPPGVSFGGLADDRAALERATMDSEWFSRLAPAMRTDTFVRLKEFLEAEERAGKTIYPPAPLIHSWSRLTPLSKIKVVIVGQDPYHQPGQACGLSFSVPRGKAIPASLQNIYKELSSEFPDFVRPNHGCLDGWARQGVLMLNACLTVGANQAGSHHNKGWEPFTREILKTIAAATVPSSTPSGSLAAMFAGKTVEEINGPRKGVVFLAWGLPAAKTLAEAGITEVRRRC
ncbi:uracil-DNA glycosylase [Malassezia cuniculi]|uniref:Uracil-DNA glycosylase n=1 Tax=Malassezia cuniculi TaxID=948313 RepID=A0AAF0ETA4_9BASI|nr:uracil-DNA glycosylase [Malassezia cuniculi]